MSKYFWIVIVLVGAWQVVGSLAEKAGKKKQQQRLKDLATQRQGQLGAPRASQPPPARSVAETLASRRRAQLEELRRRRAGQQPTQVRTQASGAAIRTGPGLAPAPMAPPPTVGRPTPFQAPPPAARRGPQPVPVPSRSAQPPAPAPQRGIPSPRPVPRPVRREPVPSAQPPAEVPVQDVRRLVPDAVITPKAPPRRRPLIPFGSEELGPALLRKMVMYREILDPPVCLRERQVWERQ